MEAFISTVAATLVASALAGVAILAFRYPESYHAINFGISGKIFAFLLAGAIWIASNKATIFIISNNLPADVAERADKVGSTISIPVWLYTIAMGLFLYFRLLDYLTAKRPGADPKKKWPGLDDESNIGPR